MDRTFPCPKCARLLQAPQGEPGDRTRCPDCHTVFAIPAAEVSREGETTVDETTRPVGKDDPLHGNPRRARFVLQSDDVFREAWRLFRQQPAALFGVYLPAITLAILVPAVVAAMIVKFGGMPIDRGAATSLWMLLALTGTIHGLWLETGLARYLLAHVRGETATWRVLFRGTRNLDCLLVISAVRVPVAVVGLALGIFPGVFWWLASSLAVYAVVDSDDTPWRMISQLRRSARGQEAAMAAVFAVASFGLLWPLPPTALLLGPLLILIPAVVYVRLTEAGAKQNP